MTKTPERETGAVNQDLRKRLALLFRPVPLGLLMASILSVFGTYLTLFIPALFLLTYELTVSLRAEKPVLTLSKWLTMVTIMLGIAGSQLYPFLLQDYLRRGDAQALQTCLALKLPFDPNMRFGRGDTPLHFFITRNQRPMIELLLDQGADLEAKGLYGLTPLFYAVQHGDVAIVELLLDKGANLHAKAHMGTVVHMAAQWEHLGVMELLLNRGADINARNNGNQTPLGLARYYRRWEMVRFLVARGGVL